MAQTEILHVTGMSCAGCAGRAERALSAVEGVSKAEVNFATHDAHVTFDAPARYSDLTQALMAAGYPAKEREAVHDATLESQLEIARLRRSVIWSAALTLPVLALAMGAHMVPGMHDLISRTIGHQASWVIQFVLTTLVLIGPGRVFFKRGIPALIRRAPDMNSLVALGSLAAWGYSTIATFWSALLPVGSREVYFEAAAMIVTLILVGRLLEARAKGQTGAAIRRLVALQPRVAQVEVDGKFVDVPVDRVKPGDLLVARPGARIAVDGVVVDGASHVDESMLTGEPMPVAKAANATVSGGTLNTTRVFKYRATAVGADTVLAQIIRMVETAQGAKLPIQGLVDQITYRFVPAVLLVALVTVLFWVALGPEPAISHALVAGVSVLIIACPCAMGLATPTSIVVGTGRAAELGVLFHKGEALQSLNDVDVVAFDKTGTLTEGRPQLTDIAFADGLDQSETLRLIAAAEAQSEHPVAKAILQATGSDLPKATDFRAHPGHGLQATVDGRTVLVGAARFFTREAIDLGNLRADGQRWSGQGKTVFYAAIDGRPAAVLSVSDKLKPATRATIAGLKRRGKRVLLLTGDSPEAAQAISAELGIEEVEAGLLPQDKLDHLKELQAGGLRVAFVGDGINDAPALAVADVGIAIGTGTDVAIETADVVLMSGNPQAVIWALDISSQTMRNIRQNLFWAFGYNVALVPVAAGLLYPAFGILLSPVFAAAAMALSSVFVVTNALRLRKAGRKHDARGRASTASKELLEMS